MNGHRYRTILGYLAAASLAVMLCACNEQAKTDDARPTPTQRPATDAVPYDPETDPDLPTLAEMRPAVSPYAAPSAEAAVVRQRITIQKMVFGRDDGRVDLALDALEPVELPDDKAALWEANGLKIARLPAERLAMWSTALPEPLAISGINIMPGIEYGQVTLVGRGLGRNFVRVVDAENQARTEKLIGGQYQLMMKLTRRVEDPDRVLIDILPHHHGPRDAFRLHTGSPEAGGTSFDELRLLADAPNKEAWLIWSTMPDAAAKPAEEPTVAVGENETDLTPPLLGRAMMTGRRNAKPVRLVLVLVVN